MVLDFRFCWIPLDFVNSYCNPDSSLEKIGVAFRSCPASLVIAQLTLAASDILRSRRYVS